MAKTKNNKILGLFANDEMFEQREEGQGDLYSPVVSLPDLTKKNDPLSAKKAKGTDAALPYIEKAVLYISLDVESAPFDLLPGRIKLRKKLRHPISNHRDGKIDKKKISNGKSLLRGKESYRFFNRCKTKSNDRT